MTQLIKKLLIGGVLYATSFLALAAPAVIFNETAIKQHVNDTFILDILITDFPVSEGGGVTLHFDASMVNVSDVTIDSSVWGFVNKSGDIDNQKGTVTNIIFSSYKGVSGEGKIASVTFKAIKKGKSLIRIEESSINPFSGDGEIISVNFGNVAAHIVHAKADKGVKK